MMMNMITQRQLHIVTFAVSATCTFLSMPATVLTSLSLSIELRSV